MLTGMSDAHYLVGLELRGRRVVVVGAGSVAQRRLPRLIRTGARIDVIAPEATPAVEGMAGAGEIRWHQRPYAEGDLRDAWYAIACTNDPSVNEAVSAEAEHRRVFCVRADAGTQGSAVTPATGEFEGLMIGVLAGGHPLRSAAVRDGIVEALREGRAPADRPPAAERSGMGKVVLVGGGPGDPELITVAGRRLLASADVVVADRLAPRELLDELSPRVEVVDAAKIPYGRAAAQEFINATLIDRAKAGKTVVRLKGGDPYLFGRGYEEVLACAQAGVPVSVVPGVTSAFAVPALADVPVTHRGVAHEVVVVSGHVGPDDPASLVDWDALAALRGTIVLLMGVERAGQFADVLLAGGRADDTPAAVIQEGSTSRQRIVRTTLGSLADDIARAGIRPPAIIVIGPVAGLYAQRAQDVG